MARGRHNKVFDLPPELITAINDSIVNRRRTYKEMEAWLREDGHNISASGLKRYGGDFLKKLERISIAREQAKAIIETSTGLKTDMAEATSTVAFQILMDVLINAEPNEKGEVPKAVLDAIRTLSTLERSTVSREKLKFEFDKGVNTAIATISERLQKELHNDQEGYKYIMGLVEKAVESLKAD